MATEGKNVHQTAANPPLESSANEMIGENQCSRRIPLPRPQHITHHLGGEGGEGAVSLMEAGVSNSSRKATSSRGAAKGLISSNQKASPVAAPPDGEGDEGG